MMFLISQNSKLYVMMAISLGLMISKGVKGSVTEVMQPNALVVSGLCHQSTACSLTDNSWPTGNHFKCGSKTVSSTSFKSAESYMITKLGSPLQVKPNSWPSTVTSQCKLLPNAAHYAYNNGLWTAYYAVVTECKCVEKTVPDCVGATRLTREACNVAKFTFCGMKLNANNLACSW